MASCPIKFQHSDHAKGAVRFPTIFAILRIPYIHLYYYLCVAAIPLTDQKHAAGVGIIRLACLPGHAGHVECLVLQNTTVRLPSVGCRPVLYHLGPYTAPSIAQHT